MPLKHNVAGTWKLVVLWHNVAGTWKKLIFKHNVTGVWKVISRLVNLPPSLSAADFDILPGGAFAQIGILSNGEWFAGLSNGTWREFGDSADYEVRVTGTGNTPSGAAINAWLPCSTNRTWSLSQSTVGGKSFTGSLEIRLAAPPNTVLDTATFAIEVEAEI